MIKKFVCVCLLFVSSYCQAWDEPLTIPLQAGRGTELLSGCENLDKFWTLMRYFDSQMTHAYCSVASGTIILNALDVPDPQNNTPAARYGTQEERFFTQAVRKKVNINSIRKIGLSLDELKLALETFGLKTKIYRGTEMSVDQFREILKAAFRQPNTYVIVNYSRNELGQGNSGHFSPIGAYNASEDRALILDVNRRRYPSVWVKMTTLHQAISTTPQGYVLPRGFLVISAPK